MKEDEVRVYVIKKSNVQHYCKLSIMMANITPQLTLSYFLDLDESNVTMD